MSGPFPSFLTPLTWPASIAWSAVVRVHGARAAARAWQAPHPVISVGNISTGGTGKSPTVRWVCDALRHMGRRPAVVMRGHRGGEQADEVREHRACRPDVPVAVGADRRAAIEALLATRTEVDVLVLDDGFQHRRVARDFDLVLVDAARPAIDGRLLPLGWLREPAANLRRAQAVVVTRASRAAGDLSRSIARHHGRPPLAGADHVWSALRVHEGGADRAEPIAWLRGRRVAAWAGIGNPVPFLDQLVEAGALVVHAPRLRDHQAYGRRRVERLLDVARRESAEAVVCTGKDWVKVAEALPAGAPAVVRPELGLAFRWGESELREALRAAVEAGDARPRR